MRGASRGMQWTLGSRPCSTRRFLTRSAAHGWYGKGFLRLAAILINSRGTCVSVHFAPQLSLVTHPYIPEKSGFPSGRRGAGALRLGFPSGVRGTLGVGYPSHWAESTTGAAQKIIGTA